MASDGTSGNSAEITKSEAFTKFYPDRHGENKYCKNDGNQPTYMTNNFDIWMFDTVEDCCRTFGGSELIQYCNEHSVIVDNLLNNLNTPVENRVTEASGKCYKRRCKYYPW